MFDTTNTSLSLERFFQDIRQKMNPNKLREVVRRLGNELIIDALLEIVTRGYSMKFGWEAKSPMTLHIYSELKRTGRTDEPWSRLTGGLVKFGRFRKRVLAERNQDHISMSQGGVLYTFDLGEIERDLGYLKEVRLGSDRVPPRDYYQALLKIINEEFQSAEMRSKMKQLIESITKLSIE